LLTLLRIFRREGLSLLSQSIPLSGEGSQFPLIRLKGRIMSRPDYVTEEHLDYLDELRNFRITNMFGATPFIQKAFGLKEKEARQILVYWMETFGKEDR